MKILVADILKSQAQTLINTVNCVGIMGKGIALEFKEHFPEMFDDYVKRCERKELKPGIPYLYKRLLPPRGHGLHVLLLREQNHEDQLRCRS